MKLSIVIPVLDSHEILRRQLLNFANIGIPDDVEIIIVDDGSNPPLNTVNVPEGLAIKIIQTNDTRPWTWALARNRGVREAVGDYLFMFDLDHFFTKETLDYIRHFNGDKIQFKRQFAILDEQGMFVQTIEALIAYGFPESRFNKRGFKLQPLPNNFVMRRNLFWELGGYREDIVERSYPQGEDRMFKKAFCEWEKSGKGHVHNERPTLYMFPNGYFCGGDVDFNPFGLFHKLSRATRRNSKHRRKK